MSYLCTIWIGLHVSEWLYAPSENVTIKVAGHWNNKSTNHYFYGVDLPYRNYTHLIENEIDCELGDLDYIEIIATSGNSLQVDRVDYVRYEGRDYYGNNSYFFHSYFFHYKSSDTCQNSCCISTDNETQCEGISSKVYNLRKTMDCDSDPCPEIKEEDYPLIDSW